MNPRPLSRSIGLIAVTMTAGIAARFLPLGLPQFLVKYAGSMLWAAMIYWLTSTMMSRSRLTAVLLLSGSLATAIECFKLYRSPSIDAFRSTLPGILLLGKYFSLRDIAAYWIAIACAAALDRRMRPPPTAI